MRQILKGATSQTFMVYAIDNLTGQPKTGLAHSDITARYERARAAAVSITMANLAAITTAYTSGGWEEIDSTNCKGWYRFDIPDAVFATGVDCAIVTMQATNALITPIAVELKAIDFTILGNAALNASVDVEQDVTIYEGANAPTLAWTITDADGVAVDVSTYTLKLVVYNYDGTTKFTLTSGGGGLVVSGSDNEIITATYTTTHSSYRDTLRYELWRADGGTTGDQILAVGAWVVRQTQKWTA